MATLPILIFPTHATAARAEKGGGETQVHLPSPTRQSSRIGPQIRRLERAFAEHTGALRTDVEGAEPEKVPAKLGGSMKVIGERKFSGFAVVPAANLR